MIEYPKHRSEFEYHAWLFCQIRMMGIDARGEVPFPSTWGNRGARFDIVVFHKQEPRRIIEVKSITKIDRNYDVPDKYKHVKIPIDNVYGGEHMHYLSWFEDNWKSPLRWPGLKRTDASVDEIKGKSAPRIA